MPDGQIIRHSEIALSRIEAIQKFKLPETRDSADGDRIREGPYMNGHRTAE